MFFYLHGVEMQFPNKYIQNTMRIFTSSCGNALTNWVQTRSYMKTCCYMVGNRGWHSRSYTPKSEDILGVESYREKMSVSLSPLNGPKIIHL